MNNQPYPTIRARRLAAELRWLREKSSLTYHTIADHLTQSVAAVVNMENAHSAISMTNLASLLNLYHVKNEHRASLLELAANASERGWWYHYSDVLTGGFVALEAQASTISTFEALIIPGLLQTEGYARAIFHSVRPQVDEQEIERRVSARAARKNRLMSVSAPRYRAVIEEGALRRSVGGADIMREQLAHLIAMNLVPTVSIRVLPFAAGAHAACDGPFVLLDFPDPAHAAVVYSENLTSAIYLEKPTEIQLYRTVFEHAWDAALDEQESQKLLAELSSVFASE